MSHMPISGEQPIVPPPEREPAAIRAAVAHLDPAALARFEADRTAATARARDEYSLLPARYFVEHWFNIRPGRCQRCQWAHRGAD